MILADHDRSDIRPAGGAHPGLPVRGFPGNVPRAVE
jgi:hypothetical protein